MQATKENTIEGFIEDYNLLYNVPNYKIDRDTCEQYRKEHPNEFKHVGWSLKKHRKKIMDWFSKQSPETKKILNKIK